MAYALADLRERSGDVPGARDLFEWVARHDPDLADAALAGRRPHLRHSQGRRTGASAQRSTSQLLIRRSPLVQVSLAGVAPDAVVHPGRPVDVVVAATAVEVVVGRAAVDDVGARPATDEVGAVTAADHVVPTEPVDGVRPAQGLDDVAAGGPRDHVVARRADHGRGQPTAAWRPRPCTRSSWWCGCRRGQPRRPGW